MALESITAFSSLMSVWRATMMAVGTTGPGGWGGGKEVLRVERPADGPPAAGGDAPGEGGDARDGGGEGEPGDADLGDSWERSGRPCQGPILTDAEVNKPQGAPYPIGEMGIPGIVRGSSARPQATGEKRGPVPRLQRPERVIVPLWTVK